MSVKLHVIYNKISDFQSLNYKFIKAHHEKPYLMPYVTKTGADQPVHPRSLISAFVIRWLDIVIKRTAVSSSIWDRAIRYTDSGFHRNSADWSVSGVRHYHPYLK